VRIDGAFRWVLTVSLMGLGGPGGWPQLASAALFKSAETQPSAASESFPTGQMPTAATWQQFLDSVRQTVLAHINTLPDFVCTQYVKRLTKFGSLGDWRIVDEIVAEVSNHENGEHYRIFTINNKPHPPETGVDMITGFSSVGDFANALYQVFSPESNASFRMEGSARIHGRKTVRVRFHVAQRNSRYYTGWEDKKVATAYRGHCWIDLATQRVVRLESEAVDVPRLIPVRASSHSTDYDLIEITGNKHWLPVRASAELQVVNEQDCAPVDLLGVIHRGSGDICSRTMRVRNVIEYKEYRKFGAEVRLAPE
jgi:hypothetical protein